MNKTRKPVAKKPVRKPKTKGWYIQSWHIWPDDTIVSVGHTYEDILAIMKRIGAKASAIRDWECSRDELKEMFATVPKGLAWKGKTSSCTVVWFREYSFSMDFYDVIVHEVSHLLDFVLNGSRGAINEGEARAYTNEFLVRSIRQRLGRMFNFRK